MPGEDLEKEVVQKTEEEVQKTEEEIRAEARTKAIEMMKERLAEYNYLTKGFEEAIESYEVLIAIVRENKERFRIRYEDILSQFRATKDSYMTQKRNVDKEIIKLNRMLLTTDKYTEVELIKSLELK